MSIVRFSSQAETDLAEILDYSTDRWGGEQADAYLTDLIDCFAQIARMPQMGRACEPIHPGYRRIEQGRHVIFYEHEEDGVFIARILHQSMLPTQDHFVGT